MKLPDNTFGHMLAQMRRSRGWTRKGLASAIGVQPRRIMNVERGYNVPLSDAHIAQVAQRLDVPAAPLLWAADKTRKAYWSQREVA